ncbi:MAG: Clp protease N-terminal domain-containing protein [Chloroflexi bacterium]|nr:Clp protease N-terminal domain-containing protein [Chloroflexota bacterium]
MKMLREMRAIKDLLTDAEGIARSMGDEQPAAEHLLLAAFDLPDGSADRVMRRFGLDRDRLRAAIVEQHAAALVAAGLRPDVADQLSDAPALEPPTGSGIYRSSPSAQEAFQRAGAMARSARRPLAGAHIVAAVAGMEHGTVAQLLERLGIERSALAAAAADELERPAS